MAYYWITEAQKYLQSLGLHGLPGDPRRGDRRPHQPVGQDNSFFWDASRSLRFGKGDVDDAEDAKAILPRAQARDPGRPGAGSARTRTAVRSARASATTSRSRSTRTPATPSSPPVSPTGTRRDIPTARSTACVAPTRGSLPEDLDEDRECMPTADCGRVPSGHQPGDRQRAGNTIIIGAQFDFAVDTSFQAAAIATVAEAKDDRPAVPAVCKAFTDRGFIRRPTATRPDRARRGAAARPPSELAPWPRSARCGSRAGSPRCSRAA